MKGALQPLTPDGARRSARHAEKVARLSEQLRGRKSRLPISRQKRVVSHQAPKANDKKHSDEKVDLVDFDEVIEIDPDRRICIAEPGIPFCKLVDRTLPLGLAPIVVPELKNITVGGAVAGCSIESM